MADNPMTEAVTHMLRAEDEPGRSLAIGELLDRLLRSTGLNVDKVGPVTAAMLLLWRSEHETDALGRAQDLALAALRRADLSPDELLRLATTGRLLMGAALELQEAKLLGAVDAETAEYVPQEEDLAFWLGKHVVQVKAVERTEVRNDEGAIFSIMSVDVLTAGGQRLAVSPKELKLYWRDGE